MAKTSEDTDEGDGAAEEPTSTTEHSIDMEKMEELYADERRAAAEAQFEQAKAKLRAATARRTNNGTNNGAPPSADNV